MSSTACCSTERQQPILRPVATSEIVGTYLRPSGPSSSLAVPVVTTTNVAFEIWNGTSWSTSAITRPLGGSYTWWASLIPPSTLIANFGTTAGVLPDAWVNPLLSITSTGTGRFFVAGLIGTVPTLTLYSSALASLTSLVLPGPPSLIDYDGMSTVAVAGTLPNGNSYIRVYNLTSLPMTLIFDREYEVEVTSVSLYSIDSSTSPVCRPHLILLATTDVYYLTGEVVTTPGPIIGLDLAPPGDIFMYDLPRSITSPYIIPSPVLLWSDHYGGLLSGAFSPKRNAIFAVNLNGTIVSWSVKWVDDCPSVVQSPESVGVPGVTGIYVKEYSVTSQLITYGVDRSVAYNIISLPWY